MTASGDRPLVSVIVPVYNDVARLKTCLADLAQQRYRHLEIVVVDNGSEDIEAVRTAAAAYRNVTVVEEPAPGSYAARNRGIDAATGDILAFTDADCRPEPGWIEAGLAQMQAYPTCGLVAGAIDIFTHDSTHPVELFESLMGLCQERFVQQDHFGATANLFTWPHVFEQVGRFNHKLKSSGDVEWGQRVYAAGLLQIYAPDAIVRHPARSSFAQLAKQARRHAGGFYDLQCRQNASWLGRNWTYARLLGFHLLPPIMFAWQTARQPRLKTWAQKAKVVYTLCFVRLIIVKSLLQLKFGGISARD